jgi:hypothetical protein
MKDIDIDWNYIIKLKEFSEYFCTKDLLQLSMNSKKSRRLFAKEAFNTLNLRSFTSNRDYSSLYIKEEIVKRRNKINHFINPYKPLSDKLICSKKEFIKDLKLFKGCPINLVVNESRRYHYLLNEVPNVFPNITTLVLNGSAFTMDTLQYLLNNFKSLECLELTENLLFHNAEISSDYTINYPTSLRSLKLGESYVAMVKDKVNSIEINNDLGEAGLHELNSNQYLPNLATFDYYVLENYPEDSGDLVRFIKLNPQLKSLKLSGTYFNFRLFDTIKDYENLTHFEFKCFHQRSNLQGYQIPVLPYIKHLHLEVVHAKIDEIFVDNFPNVTEIVIESRWGINDNQNNIIESFKNLKSLKFISNDKFDSIENLTLPKINCLEKLEINLNYEKGSFKDVQCDLSAYDKLKLFTYTKSGRFSPFEKPNLTDELTKNWDFYYFPHSLTFVKSY